MTWLAFHTRREHQNLSLGILLNLKHSRYCIYDCKVWFQTVISILLSRSDDGALFLSHTLHDLIFMPRGLVLAHNGR